MKPTIFFQFEPWQLANLNMDSLLEAFDASTIAVPSLSGFCGVVEVRFSHTDGVAHPILNMDLRRFLRVMATRWGPHSAPFFCKCDNSFLWLYWAAQLDHLVIIQRESNERVEIRHKPDELEALHRIAQEGIFLLGNRAGMTADKIRHRQETILKFLSAAFRNPLS